MRMRFALGVLAAVASAYSVGCTPVRHNLPPAERLMEPGPGVGGPGPGVLAPETVPVGAPGMGMGVPYRVPMAQLEFRQPESMQVLYDAVGDGTFTSEPLVVPARKEFQQGGIYRLKLTNIQGREGVDPHRAGQRHAAGRAAGGGRRERAPEAGAGATRAGPLW